MSDQRSPRSWLRRAPVRAPRAEEDGHGLGGLGDHAKTSAGGLMPGFGPRGRSDGEVEVLGMSRGELLEGRLASFVEPLAGHADMYGGFVVPPDDGADLGVVFWHKDGFSTACGHGTIALGTWAVDTGRVTSPAAGVVDVLIDVPPGRVTARVHRVEGRVGAVDFVNVPSWVVARTVPVTTSRCELQVAVAYGGAFYATLPASNVGLSVTPDGLGYLIGLGREIKWALNEPEHAVHPTDAGQNSSSRGRA